MENNKKILGLYHSEGEFNYRKYDNYVFFIGYQYPDNNNINQGIGFILTDKVKMSKDNFEKLIDRLGFDSSEDFLTCEVEEVFYNQYRQAVSFILTDV